MLGAIGTTISGVISHSLNAREGLLRMYGMYVRIRDYDDIEVGDEKDEKMKEEIRKRQREKTIQNNVNPSNSCVT